MVLFFKGFYIYLHFQNCFTEHTKNYEFYRFCFANILFLKLLNNVKLFIKKINDLNMYLYCIYMYMYDFSI